MSSRRTALTLSVLIAFATASAVAAPKKEDAQSLYRRGVSEQKAGNVAKALEIFQSAAAADPTYGQPLLAAALIHKERFEKEMRGYDEACQAFETVLALLEANPQSNGGELSKAFYFAGLLHLKGGDYEAALADLDRYAEVDPENLGMAQVHNARGIACYYLDKYDKASVCFKNALKIDPGYAEARFNLRSVFTRINAYSDAQVFYRTRELERALKKLAALSEIAPRYLAGRRLEAKILTELNRPEEAIIVYSEILGFQPNDPETYWMRIEYGRTLLALGRKDAARVVLLENLSRFPNVEDLRARIEVLTLMAKTGGP